MLNLQTKLKLDKAAIQSPNLADRFSEADLAALGEWVFEGFEQDKKSRSKWEKRNEAGMDLALQIQKTKSFPWPNCSNVAFPLVTIAVMQFHARAYSALLDGPTPVQYRVVSDDPDGSATARALRVSAHMSYQILEEDEAWEEQHDRLLINLPIVGTAFKKSFHSPSMGHNVSELVLARDLVVNYWAKSLEACPRKTHIIPLWSNDIYERVKRGVFCDVLEEAWYTRAPQVASKPAIDNRSGQTPPPQADETTPFETLEQHVDVDLDQDGYAEPYIITIEKESKRVLRIVTGFERENDIERDRRGDIISVRRTEYFTKYPFIPSPDGGFYDIGFGVFLGPLNESVNTIINQLIDAGTLASTAGGFLAKGAKIRGGAVSFSPFTWNRVEMSGDDIQKAMAPLQVREPSGVLFQLLGLLIDYTNRISGSMDTMVGESPGQNTPAETTRTVAEQGLKIYNSTFKRIWRAMKREFRKLYILNGMHMPETVTFGAGRMKVSRADYLGDPRQIAPTADPNLSSDTARMQKAAMLKQVAATTPGYDTDEVERYFLRAAKIDGAERMYKGTANSAPQGPSEKVQIAMLKEQTKMAELELDRMMFAAEMMETVRLNTAKITEMEANVLKLLSDVSNDSVQQEISVLQTALGAMKQRNESIMQRVQLIMKGVKDATERRGVPSVAGSPSNQGALPSPASPQGGSAAEMGGGGVR